MLTSDRDMAAGVSSSLTASGHVVLDDAAPRIIPTRMPHGPATGGEIDESSYPALVSALEGFAGESGDFYVHLACMAFCGLVGLTRVSLSGHGARRVVHGVPPHLKAMLRILAWDCTPGLVLHERNSSSIPPRSRSTTGGAMRMTELRCRLSDLRATSTIPVNAARNARQRRRA
jgi:hypothetical protein